MVKMLYSPYMPPGKKPTGSSDLPAINIPETNVERIPHTRASLQEAANEKRVSRITKEFSDGLSFINKYQRSVTIYGSARFLPENVHYKDARALAFKLSKRGYAIITGGGPGIMEAGNRGAMDAEGDSIGLNIELPHEQIINPYVTDSLSFYYFFARKTTMSYSAEAYIFFPGGFGTLDEFFEIITLIQTKKMHRVPIVLVGSDFWDPLKDFMEKTMLQIHGTIAKKDLHLFAIIDDKDEVIEYIEENQFHEVCEINPKDNL